GRKLQTPFSSWLRPTENVLVKACHVAPPSLLTETLYLRGVAPLLMSVGLAICPLISTRPPNGLSTGVKPAAPPLARPVIALLCGPCTRPTVSMNGAWPVRLVPGLM